MLLHRVQRLVSSATTTSSRLLLGLGGYRSGTAATAAASHHASPLQWAVAMEDAQVVVRSVESTLPPAIAVAAWTLLPSLIPNILLAGKSKWTGKNKRYPNKANHGAKPCSHVGRKQRQAAKGRLRPPIR